MIVIYYPIIFSHKHKLISLYQVNEGYILQDTLAAILDLDDFMFHHKGKIIYG